MCANVFLISKIGIYLWILPGPIPGVVQNPVVWKISAVSPLQMAIFGLIPHVFKNCVNGLEIYGKYREIYGTYLRNIVKWEWVNLYSVATCPAKPAVTRLLLTCLAANSTITFQVQKIVESESFGSLIRQKAYLKPV